MSDPRFFQNPLSLRVSLICDDEGMLRYRGVQGSFASVGILGRLSYFGEVVGNLFKLSNASPVVLSSQPLKSEKYNRVSQSYLETFAEFLRLRGVKVRVERGDLEI